MYIASHHSPDGLPRSAEVEQREVHIVHGHDLHEAVARALDAGLVFPRPRAARVALDVEEEERVRAVVLQPLRDVAHAAVAQGALHAAVGTLLLLSRVINQLHVY